MLVPDIIGTEGWFTLVSGSTTGGVCRLCECLISIVVSCRWSTPLNVRGIGVRVLWRQYMVAGNYVLFLKMASTACGKDSLDGMWCYRSVCFRNTSHISYFSHEDKSSQLLVDSFECNCLVRSPLRSDW